MAHESGASASLCGRGADCAKARDLARPSEARSLRERANKRKPEGLGSQRVASVCRRPGAPNKSGRAERPRVYAVAEPAATPEDRQSERSEVCRDRAKKSTICRRGGPVAAKRSSGLPRRQGGSPSGADGRGCQAAGGAERSPALTDDGTREGGRGRTARQAVHQAGRKRRCGATPATATPDAFLADPWNGGEATSEQVSSEPEAWKENTARGSARAVPVPGAAERAGDALARARKGECRGRDRAGAEECPGAAPASA